MDGGASGEGDSLADGGGDGEGGGPCRPGTDFRGGGDEGSGSGSKTELAVASSGDGRGRTASADWRTHACLLTMALVGSTTAPAAKYAVNELPVEILPALRFGLAGLILSAWLWPRRAEFVRMLRGDWIAVLAAAFFCVPVNQWFFLHGTKLAPSSHVGLIYATCPAVVLSLACLLGMERARPDRLIGIGLSVLGMFVIGYGSLTGAGAGPGSGADVLKGDLLLVGAVVSWSAYMIASKPLLKRHDPMMVLLGTFSVGSAMCVPWVAATWPGAGAFEGVSTTAWLGVAHLIVVVTVFGLALQNVAMKRLDASQVAAVGNLAPILTIVWSVLLFGDKVTAPLVIGGALALSGVFFANRPGKRAKSVGTTLEPVASAPMGAIRSASVFLPPPVREPDADEGFAGDRGTPSAGIAAAPAPGSASAPVPVSAGIPVRFGRVPKSKPGASEPKRVPIGAGGR